MNLGRAGRRSGRPLCTGSRSGIMRSGREELGSGSRAQTGASRAPSRFPLRRCRRRAPRGVRVRPVCGSGGGGQPALPETARALRRKPRRLPRRGGLLRSRGHEDTLLHEHGRHHRTGGGARLDREGGVRRRPRREAERSEARESRHQLLQRAGEELEDRSPDVRGGRVPGAVARDRSRVPRVGWPGEIRVPGEARCRSRPDSIAVPGGESGDLGPGCAPRPDPGVHVRGRSPRLAPDPRRGEGRGSHRPRTDRRRRGGVSDRAIRPFPTAGHRPRSARVLWLHRRRQHRPL